jgi:transcription termination/antitermination protein NusA
MPSELERIIEQVGKDKGIQKQILIDALQAAMISAAKKKFGPHRDLEAQYNPELGEVELFEFKTVVELVNDPSAEISLEDAKKTDPEAEPGDSLGQKIPTETFGRIAAQTAKQVIMQKVREAEREMVYDLYKDQKGELVHGTVQRFEKGDMIVNLGRAEAVVPFKEQIPRENYRIGDRIRAYIFDVDKNAKGPLVKLSRVRPEMLIKLFELEVPEIYDGIVEIKGAAREPGGRAKIAVYSRDIDVDPVGACVGMKGSRVQAIVYELRGEKIDIVPYSNDIATYVCNGLAPAEISKVIIDEREHAIEVVVPDNQLSLAIGKKGQNVRLASKLLGWKIEIHGETDAEQSFQVAKAKLEELEGVGDVVARSLINAGVYSVEDIEEWDAESIAQATQMGLKKAQKLKELAREHMSSAVEKDAGGQGETQEGAPAGDSGDRQPVATGAVGGGDEGSAEPEGAGTSPTHAASGEPEEEVADSSTSRDRL